MQLRGLLIGLFITLGSIVLTPQLSHASLPDTPQMGTQVLQNQCEAACRGQGYEHILSLLPNRTGEAGGPRMLQLLTQNQQAPATVQEPTTSGEKLDLGEQLTRDIFEPLQRGIQGHNLDQVLSVFDRQDMPDYAQLSDQLRAFFEQYDAIRFRYQLLQAPSSKNHATAVAEIAMDANPIDPSQVTMRRETQMRFRMTLGTKGWKLTGFTPADFFAK